MSTQHYIAEPEDVHAHFERGARIAFAALEASAVTLTLEEQAWYEAELKRGKVELCVVKYYPDGTRGFCSSLRHVTRAEVEDIRAETFQRWADMGMPLVEPDGSRWDVEVRE